MSIQWFPGHMHLTRKAIAERVKAIDVVIEMLDARLPGSSANPLLAELTGHKPTLKVLNKQDMADPARTTNQVIMAVTGYTNQQVFGSTYGLLISQTQIGP